MRHSRTIDGQGEISFTNGGMLGVRTYRIEQWQREKDVYYLQGAPRASGQLKEEQVWIDLSTDDRAALEDKDATLTTNDGRKLHFRVQPNEEIVVLVGLH